MISWTAALLLIMKLTQGQEWSDNSDNAFQGTERCVTASGIGVVGIRPDTADGNCRKFQYCRVTGFPTEQNSFPVQATAFTCPTKEAPYYNAMTCRCEAQSDHCEENHRYINNCVRPYVYGEAEETCQSYRDASIFYQSLIPRFGRPREFWSCAYNDHPVYKTTAHRFNCTEDLTFDMRSCDCRYTQDQEGALELNNNPLYRYACAEEVRRYPGGKTKGTKLRAQPGFLT